MTKFVYIYHGGGAAGKTQEIIDASMKEWEKWFGQIGEHLVDAGAPFGKVMSVQGEKASTGADNQATGYSIVNAGSLEEATNWAKMCPVDKDGGSVEVYETLPM